MHNTGRAKSRQREKVLIVLNVDGFVEVYAEDHVDCRIVNRVDVSDPEAEILAERVVEKQLPPAYCDLFYPGGRRAIGNVESIRPSDLWQRETNSRIHKTLRLWSNSESEVASCLV